MGKPVKIFDIKEHDGEWLEHRKLGIGGSDAAAVLGVSKWVTPFQLWLEKTNRQEREDISGKDYVYFGTLLEDIVAKEFERRAEKKVQRRNAMYQHPDHPFMIADVDRVVVGENWGLECKTANAFKADEWKGDKVPDTYYVQVQHYIAVMGWDGCYIACLIGGNTFVWKAIPRNDAFINTLIAAEGTFWDGVKKDMPPSITGSDNIAILFPEQHDDEYLKSDAGFMETARRILQLDEDIQALEEQQNYLKNQLKLAIGDAAGISGICSWKQSKDSHKVDWKKVAEELGATSEIIEKYTTITKGARPFKMILKED